MNTIASTNPQSGRLSKEALDYLQAKSDTIQYEADSFIVHRGEAGQYFFVVLSGEVEVRLAGSGGESLPLARLGEGATFGEMALIRNEPVSADVVAIGAVNLLACPEHVFRQGLAECEPLRTQLLARLAGDLKHTTHDAWDFFQRAEALRLLIRCESKAEPLVADCAPMRQLVRSLERMAQDMDPCLITGEAGTGKLLAARTLHENAHGILSPLIIVDCQRLRSSDEQRLLLGPPGSSESEDVLRGLGALHLARGGSLILRHVDSLKHSLQGALSEVIASSEPGGARVIATMRTTAGDDSSLAGLHPALAAVFSGQTLLVPPLRKRRRDIVKLASLFLSQLDDGEIVLGNNAQNTLVSMDFQRGNATQLRETVEFAARCTDRHEIRSEHIFSGLETGEKDPGMNLGPLRGLRFLLREHSLSVIRGVVLLNFLATIVLCLILPASFGGTAANAIVWTVWEPIVFALFLLVGSIWCTVCPLSTAGRLTRHFFSLNRPPPERLKVWSTWMMVLTFFLIIWAENSFHMTRNPAATGFLLLGLILAPIAFCALYTREVWCRHVCPLGALATGLAPSAILEVSARSEVCTSTCTSHSCYKGEGTIPGCTVFHHPLNTAENHHCKLCFDCLKSCPHDSAKLFLRPPLTGIWKLEGSGGAVAFFAIAVFMLALIFLAAQTYDQLATPLTLAIVGLAAIGSAAVYHRALPSFLMRVDKDSETPIDSRVAVQVAFSLLILGWGPLMAYQFGNISLLESLTLEPAPMSFWNALPLPTPWTVMASMQVTIIAVAATLALIAMARIHGLAQGRGTPLSTLGWTVLAAICTAYTAVALLLVV